MYILEEIPQNSGVKFTSKSSGLEVEANLDIKDRSIFSQCSKVVNGNANKVSIFKLTIGDWFIDHF